MSSPTLGSRIIHNLLHAGLGVAAAAGCASYDLSDGSAQELDLGAGAVAPFDPAQLDGAQKAGISKELDIFLRSPMTTGGIPMIIFRILPDLAPEIWGSSVEEIPSVGLFRDPGNANAPLPLGLGYAAATPQPGAAPGQPALQVVNLTCAACHSGQIELPNGKRTTLIGAPSSRFDVPGFRLKVLKTTKLATFTGANIRALIEKKEAAGNPHWIFNDPKMAAQHKFEVMALLHGTKKFPDGTEVNLSDLLLQSLSDKTQQRMDQLRSLLASQPGGEGAAIAGEGGQTDGVGGAMALFGIKPHGSIGVDYPSVWRQDTRAHGQYDGTVANGFFRNIAAVAGGGTTLRTPKSPKCASSESDDCIAQPDLSIFVAYQTWKAIEGLPAPKYPLATQSNQVKQGGTLFGQYCASCHAMPDALGKTPRFTKLVPLSEDRDADAVRSRQFEGTRAPLLRAALINACRTGNRKGRIGSQDYEVPLEACDANPEDVIRDTSANPVLAAQPLTGIWSTGPYLHNGSVPTLRALLLGNSKNARPVTFARGGTVVLDTKNVGLTPKKGTGEYIFDTTKIGHSNRGHATQAMLGRDWSLKDNAADLEALLEYLKTL
jgi:cytochrome c5